MSISSVGSAASSSASGSAYSQFANASGITFTASQQVAGAQASTESSLLSDLFGTDGSTSAASGIAGAPATSDTDGMAALLNAYTNAKSLTPIALSYLVNLPSNSTTSTYA